MISDEAQIEASEAMVTAERETAIARIRDALTEPGEDICIDCDHPIPPARREAMPSAERCIVCQSRFEKGQL